MWCCHCVCAGPDRTYAERGSRASSAISQARGRPRRSRIRHAVSSEMPLLLVSRRVSVRGAIMIGGQRIQVGLPHAGKTAEGTVNPTRGRCVAHQVELDSAAESVVISGCLASVSRLRAGPLCNPLAVLAGQFGVAGLGPPCNT